MTSIADLLWWRNNRDQYTTEPEQEASPDSLAAIPPGEDSGCFPTEPSPSSDTLSTMALGMLPPPRMPASVRPAAEEQLRDRFAMNAIEMAITRGLDPVEAAIFAYEIADAMIARRGR